MTTPSMFKTLGLLSTGDIAKRVGVHRTTVWHWITSGMIKSIAVTPRFRGVKEDDLKAFLSSWVDELPKAAAAVSPAKPRATKKQAKKPTKKPKAAKKAR